MPSHFDKLCVELREMVDSHIEDLGVETMRAACLVSKEWAGIWLPKAHREVVLEAYIVRNSSSDCGFVSREYHDILYQLMEHDFIRSNATRVVFRGPSLARRLEMAVNTVTSGPGMLTPCSVREALYLLPQLDSVVFEDVLWVDCPLVHSTGWSGVEKRAFKTISFVDVDVLANDASPFMILRAASSVDELIIGFMDDFSPAPLDISEVSLRRVILQSVASSGPSSFSLLSTATRNSIRDLEVLDMGNHNIDSVETLLGNHAESLEQFNLSFHTIDNDKPVTDWHKIPFKSMVCLRDFGITIDIGDWNLEDCILGQEVIEYILTELPDTVEILEIRFFTLATELAHPRYALSRTRWDSLDASLSRRQNLKIIKLFFDVNVPCPDKGCREMPVHDALRADIEQCLARSIDVSLNVVSFMRVPPQSD